MLVGILLDLILFFFTIEMLLYLGKLLSTYSVGPTPPSIMLYLLFYDYIFLSFTGKELICCETAMTSYEDICATVGGPNEKIRAEQLVKRITVLPDVPIPVELAKLNVSGQIKPRSLSVFSFGIAHKALTVTANKSFIRSAKMQVGMQTKFSFIDFRIIMTRDKYIYRSKNH